MAEKKLKFEGVTKTLSQPATRALFAAGYMRLEQLIGVPEAALAKLHGMGPKALGILREALAELPKTTPADPFARVRQICLALPDSGERLSHGEPTFFVKNKVFVMCANNHHNDGHVAIWLPVPEGAQAALIASTPRTFYKPPYVGVKGWVGIELAQIADDELRSHIHTAWDLIAPKKRAR